MLKIEPAVEAFPADRPTVVWTTLVADLETPVSAFLKLAEGRPNAILLESVEGGAVRGRYSILGLAPDVIWRCQGAQAEINRRALTQPDAFEPCAEPSLQALRALIAESAIDLPPGLPPMAAGIFGYLGYDMVRLMEKLAPAKPDPIGVADAILVRPTIVVVFDAVRDEITLVTPVRPATGVTPQQAIRSAALPFAITHEPGHMLVTELRNSHLAAF